MNKKHFSSKKGMKSKTLRKVINFSLATFISISLTGFVYKKADNYRKLRASLVKPSEMVAVKIDENLRYKYLRYNYITKEEISRVEEIAKQDYKTVIKELKTPLEAIIYCTEVLEGGDDKIIYGKLDYWASFKRIHSIKKDDCDGGALAAAAILSDNGFPAYIAILRNFKEAHAVFIYKTTKGKYGSIGVNDCDCVSNCKSIKELKERVGKRMWREFRTIKIYDLGKRYPNYIDSDRSNDPESWLF